MRIRWSEEYDVPVLGPDGVETVRLTGEQLARAGAWLDPNTDTVYLLDEVDGG